MKPYLDLLRQILDYKRASLNRTATPTIKIAGGMMRFDLMRGRDPILPATTTKYLFFPGVKKELCWFIRGSTNAMELHDDGVHIWDGWMLQHDVYEQVGMDQQERWALYQQANGLGMENTQPGVSIQSLLTEANIPFTKNVIKHAKGSVGPAYGYQWRHWPAGNYFYNLSEDELFAYVDAMAPDQRVQLANAFEPGYQEAGQLTNAVLVTIPADELRRQLTKIGIDQISQALNLLKTLPNSRRIIVNAWNPQAVPSDKLSAEENILRGRSALACCHAFFQFLTEELTEAERLELVPEMEYGSTWAAIGPGMAHVKMPSLLALAKHVEEAAHKGELTAEQAASLRVDTHSPTELMDMLKIPKYRLNSTMYQRSVDSFLGLPFNIASYALLTHMVARHVNMVPGQFVWMGGDIHLYTNHLEQVEEQLSREPYQAPKLWLNPKVTNLFDFESKDIKLKEYQHHPALKGEVAI
jgi:thymidylate synthase